MIREVYKEMDERTKTPAGNRILMGIITIFFTLAFIKVVTWAMWQERAPMNPIAWIPVFGLPLIGFTIITIKGDIRLRLHKWWTPIGLFAIFWCYYFLIIDLWPGSNGLYDFLVHRSSESWLWIVPWGLVVAFVDWSIFKRYAYWFIFYALFLTIFFLPGLIMFPFFVIQHGLPTAHNINEMNDIFATVAGPFFLYFIIWKLKNEWPGWKKIGLAFLYFALGFVVVAILSNIIGDAYPQESWVHQVMKSEARPNAQPKGGVPLFN